MTIAVDDIGEAVAAFAGAVYCAVAAFRLHGRPRIAWSFLAVSAFPWGPERWLEIHGGRIWFETAMGAGSKFLFTVPLQVNVAPSRERRVRTASASSR